MNRKFSLGICISLIAIASAITFVLTMTLSINMYNSKIAGVEERELIYTKMQELDTFTRNNGLYVINRDDLLKSILDGYAQGLGDPNARYMMAEDYYEFQQKQKGKIVTAGITAAREESGYIKVTEVYDGSTAHTQMIAVGDIITHVDSVSVLEIGADEAIKKLSGEEGGRLAITIQRDGAEHKYTLIRQQIEIVQVTSAIHMDYGFIRINGFSELTGTQFNTIYDDMVNQNVKGFIFDLRGTSGDLIQPLREILNKLIPSKALATAEYKDGIVNNIIQTDEFHLYEAPIVILVDNNTAKVSELFTAILKDFRNAQLVGLNTSGNDVIPRTQSFKDGSAITVSYMRVKSMGDTDFGEVGIKPEYIVEIATPIETDLNNLGQTQDTQINKAFEVITTQN